jgi:hypothetical protein
MIAPTRPQNSIRISPRLEEAPLDDEDRHHWPMLAVHLEGEMGASQTVLPFKLAASGESLTAHADWLCLASICGR